MIHSVWQILSIEKKKKKFKCFVHKILKSGWQCVTLYERWLEDKGQQIKPFEEHPNY